MTRIILLISCLFLLSCAQEQPRKLYKTDNGYCYQDSDMLWHIYLYDTMTGTYVESTSTTAPSYDNSTTYSSTEVGVETETTTETGMTETTGEDTGGSDGTSDADSSDGGMSESSGSDSGGSDFGGDSGGGDSGGGE